MATLGLAIGPSRRVVWRRPMATRIDAGSASMKRAVTSPTASGAPTAATAGPISSDGSHGPGSGVKPAATVVDSATVATPHSTNAPAGTSRNQGWPATRGPSVWFRVLSTSSTPNWNSRAKLSGFISSCRTSRLSMIGSGRNPAWIGTNR